MESKQQNSESDSDPQSGSDPESQQEPKSAADSRTPDSETPDSETPNSETMATLTNAQLVSRGHVMYWIVAMINLVPIVICMIVVRPELTQSFGAVFHMALLFLMWQGNGFARWIMVATFSLLSTVLIVLGAVQDYTMVTIGVIFMIVPMLLMTASVNAWLAHQRAAWKAQIIENINKKKQRRKK